MLSTLANKQFLALWRVSKAGFSGGHHHPKPFDWREDFALNPSRERDIRRMGIPDAYAYTYPGSLPARPTYKVFDPEYNFKDLTQNYVGTKPQLPYGAQNLLDVAEQNLEDDIAHEKEYDSEDMDHQPLNFETQHFRKKGNFWMWVLPLTAPFWYVCSEFIYQATFGTDVFKYQRPPPLNYPNEEDTPDTQAFQNYQTKEYKVLWDAGKVKDPFFEIVDGKKIYSKWAGVNEPGVPIINPNP